MLILTRKLGENILIGDKISVKIVSIEHNKVQVGIKAPSQVMIYRQELIDKIRIQNHASIVRKRIDFLHANRLLKGIISIKQ